MRVVVGSLSLSLLLPFLPVSSSIRLLSPLVVPSRHFPRESLSFSLFFAPSLERVASSQLIVDETRASVATPRYSHPSTAATLAAASRATPLSYVSRRDDARHATPMRRFLVRRSLAARNTLTDVSLSLSLGRYDVTLARLRFTDRYLKGRVRFSNGTSASRVIAGL